MNTYLEIDEDNCIRIYEMIFLTNQNRVKLNSVTGKSTSVVLGRPDISLKGYILTSDILDIFGNTAIKKDIWLLCDELVFLLQGVFLVSHEKEKEKYFFEFSCDSSVHINENAKQILRKYKLNRL